MDLNWKESCTLLAAFEATLIKMAAFALLGDRAEYHALLCQCNNIKKESGPLQQHKGVSVLLQVRYHLKTAFITSIKQQCKIFSDNITANLSACKIWGVGSPTSHFLRCLCDNIVLSWDTHVHKVANKKGTPLNKTSSKGKDPWADSDLDSVYWRRRKVTKVWLGIHLLRSNWSLCKSSS